MFQWHRIYCGSSSWFDHRVVVVCARCFVRLRTVAVGFACLCHLCLCAPTSWRWHGSSRLCPTSRCKVLLRSLSRLLQLHLSHTAACSRRAGNSPALKGPCRIFWPVDLSQDTGSSSTLKRWKDCSNIEWTPFIVNVPIVCILSAHFIWFDRLFSVANINSIPLIVAVWDIRALTSRIQLLEQRWKSKTVIHHTVT